MTLLVVYFIFRGITISGYRASHRYSSNQTTSFAIAFTYLFDEKMIEDAFLPYEKTIFFSLSKKRKSIYETYFYRKIINMHLFIHIRQSYTCIYFYFIFGQVIYMHLFIIHRLGLTRLIF
jgi:hypothetical protein